VGGEGVHPAVQVGLGKGDLSGLAFPQAGQCQGIDDGLAPVQVGHADSRRALDGGPGIGDQVEQRRQGQDQAQQPAHQSSLR
jgi:hypothetical protein